MPVTKASWFYNKAMPIYWYVPGTYNKGTCAMRVLKDNKRFLNSQKLKAPEKISGGL